MPSIGKLTAEVVADPSNFLSGMDRVKKSLKELKDKFGEESAVGGLAKILVGAGAIAGLSTLTRAVDEASKKALELQGALFAGEETAGSLVVELAKGLPILGSLVDAAANLGTFLEQAANKQVIKDNSAALAGVGALRSSLSDQQSVVGLKGTELAIQQIENAAAATDSQISELGKALERTGQFSGGFTESLYAANAALRETKLRAVLLDELEASENAAKQSFKVAADASASAESATTDAVISTIVALEKKVIALEESEEAVQRLTFAETEYGTRLLDTYDSLQTQIAVLNADHEAMERQKKDMDDAARSAKGYLEAIKTPADKLADAIAEIQALNAQNLLTDNEAKRAIDATRKNILGVAVRGPGTRIGPDVPTGIQSAQALIGNEIDETNKLLRQIRDKLDGQAVFV